MYTLLEEPLPARDIMPRWALNVALDDPEVIRDFLKPDEIVGQSWGNPSEDDET